MINHSKPYVGAAKAFDAINIANEVYKEKKLSFMKVKQQLPKIIVLKKKVQFKLNYSAI